MANLNILIIDTDFNIVELLKKIIETNTIVNFVDIEDPINSYHKVENGNYNTIIIDPFARSLNFTSSLIFKIRKEYPKIVIVLLVDFEEVENTNHFYNSERSRLKHYFKVNKKTPLYLLDKELISVLFDCQNYLIQHNIEKKLSAKKEKIYNEYIELSFEVKKLISLDKLSEALKKMEEYYREKDAEYHKNTLLMMLKMTNAEKDKNNQLIEYSNYIRLKMQVANSAIEIINKKKDVTYNTKRKNESPQFYDFYCYDAFQGKIQKFEADIYHKQKKATLVKSNNVIFDGILDYDFHTATSLELRNRDNNNKRVLYIIISDSHVPFQIKELSIGVYSKVDEYGSLIYGSVLILKRKINEKFNTLIDFEISYFLKNKEIGNDRGFRFEERRDIKKYLDLYYRGWEQTQNSNNSSILKNILYMPIEEVNISTNTRRYLQDKEITYFHEIGTKYLSNKKLFCDNTNALKEINQLLNDLDESGVLLNKILHKIKI